MRRVVSLSLFWAFAFGLSACDSSKSDGPRVPIPDDAGEADEPTKPSRAGTAGTAGTAGKSGSEDTGSGMTAGPRKPPPGNADTDEPDGGSGDVTCGGFAGFTCPGLGRCGDDEADDCDPDRGGADCAGICICDAKAKCRDGQTWNADPEACRCEDAEAAEADAGVEDAATVEPTGCGGIAAFECPGAGTCEDDPEDDCDPMSGGADCGGVCQCNVLGVCIAPAVWNASPDVCACES
jgi:hypothetical protein